LCVDVECVEQQLNVRVPAGLYVEVKMAAVAGHLKLRRLVSFLLSVALYFHENLGLSETVKAVREAEPLAFLLAARNDLARRGFNVHELDAVIVDARAFLGVPNKKEVEKKNGKG